MKNALPRIVTVNAIVTSRYDDPQIKSQGGRPLSWDQRVSGVEVIRSAEEGEVKLSCDGGQSTPHPGWSLMLTGGDSVSGYTWTLYGIAPEQSTSTSSLHR